MRAILVAIPVFAAFVLIAGVTLRSCRSFNASEALFDATGRGDIADMQRCIDRGADVNFKFDDTTTSLESSIEGNQPTVAAFLLSKGADPTILPVHYQHLLKDPGFRRRMYP